MGVVAISLKDEKRDQIWDKYYKMKLEKIKDLVLKSAERKYNTH